MARRLLRLLLLQGCVCLSAGLCRARGGSYDGSGWVAKGFVGGLTAVVNAVFGDRVDLEARAAREAERLASGEVVTPAQLVDGLRADFGERGYLFTGEISSELYDLGCSFRDPTIAFEGLDTFESNLRNLRPILDAVLEEDRRVVLREGPTLDEASRSVRAAWTMSGGLKLPWRPRIELDGATTFTYDPARQGRIVRYDETWELSAMEALGQLFRPAARGA